MKTDGGSLLTAKRGGGGTGLPVGKSRVHLSGKKKKRKEKSPTKKMTFFMDEKNGPRKGKRVASHPGEIFLPWVRGRKNSSTQEEKQKPPELKLPMESEKKTARLPARTRRREPNRNRRGEKKRRWPRSGKLGPDVGKKADGYTFPRANSNISANLLPRGDVT